MEFSGNIKNSQHSWFQFSIWFTVDSEFHILKKMGDLRCHLRSSFISWEFCFLMLFFCLFLKMRKLLHLASHLLWNQDWGAKVPFWVSKEDVLYLSEIHLLIRTKCDFYQTSFPFSLQWDLQVLSIFWASWSNRCLFPLTPLMCRALHTMLCRVSTGEPGIQPSM